MSESLGPFFEFDPFPSRNTIKNLHDAINFRESLSPTASGEYVTSVIDPISPIFNGSLTTRRTMSVAHQGDMSFISISELSDMPHDRQAMIFLGYALSARDDAQLCQVLRPHAVLRFSKGNAGVGIEMAHGHVSANFDHTPETQDPLMLVVKTGLLVNKGLQVPGEEELRLLTKLLWEDAEVS